MAFPTPLSATTVPSSLFPHRFALTPTHLLGRLASSVLLLLAITAVAHASTAAVTVAAPTATQIVPSTFVVPITVQDITQQAVFAYQFNIVYDPAVIDPLGPNFGCSTDGTLAGAAGMIATCNVAPEGLLRVAVYGAYSMNGAGTILNLTFKTDAAATAGSVSQLGFEDAYFFNEFGYVETQTQNGSISLVTAAPTPTPTPAPQPDVTVLAPSSDEVALSTFVVPIKVDDISNDGIIAFQFNIAYDPAVIAPTGPNFGCSTDGTLAGDAGMVVLCNVSSEGTLRVAVYGTYSLTGAGTLLNMTFSAQASAHAGSVSPLNFENVFFFNGNGPLTTAQTNGAIRLVAPVIRTKSGRTRR